MEHLFHILYSKDGKLLQRVGIFRVQPGILEVGFVMYQIRRPLGLVFVIYFWWLGELLLLYI